MLRRMFCLLMMSTFFYPSGLVRAVQSSGEEEEGAIFVPTPADVVTKMLEVAKVTKDDLLYDLGCGDGRIVIAAALNHGCRAVGYEIDDRKVRQSKENVQRNRLEKLVRIQQQDIFTLDLREASVITLYLLPEMNDQLVPQLKQMKTGCRIVAHDFAIDGYQHDRLVTLKSKEDGTPHDIFLYTLPLRDKRAGE
jgi:SAM-dependent methyltransferase